jgi:hypothetical protein
VLGGVGALDRLHVEEEDAAFFADGGVAGVGERARLPGAKASHIVRIAAEAGVSVGFSRLIVVSGLLLGVGLDFVAWLAASEWTCSNFIDSGQRTAEVVVDDRPDQLVCHGVSP